MADVGATHAGASEEPELSNFTFLSNASGDSYNYHRIEIPDNGTALFATIHPANPVDIYYVYLKYDGFPNETYYDWVGVVPDPALDEADPKRYVFAPPQNYTSVNGTYRIGIRLKGPQCLTYLFSSFFLLLLVGVDQCVMTNQARVRSVECTLQLRHVEIGTVSLPTSSVYIDLHFPALRRYWCTHAHFHV